MKINFKVGDVAVYHPPKTFLESVLKDKVWSKRIGKEVKITKTSNGRVVQGIIEGENRSFYTSFLQLKEPRGHHLTRIFK